MKNEQPILTITERTQHRDTVLSCLSSLDWEDALDILAIAASMRAIEGHCQTRILLVPLVSFSTKE